jgi:hypothetical protein
VWLDWRLRSFDEVIQRWLCIHKGPFLIKKYLKGEVTGKEEMTVLIKLVEDWRIRLSNISEFMQQLNQVISRQANIEENCTGRFWDRNLLLGSGFLLRSTSYLLRPVVVQYRP